MVNQRIKDSYHMFFLWGQLRYPRGGCFRYADFLYAFIADFEPKFLYKILENRDKKFLYKISLFCHVVIEFDRRYMCWNTIALQYVIKSIATPCFRTTVRMTVKFSDTKSSRWFRGSLQIRKRRSRVSWWGHAFHVRASLFHFFRQLILQVLGTGRRVYREY